MTLLHLVYLLILVGSISVGALLSRILMKKAATARWTSAFAAGVLLAICFLYLLPEAFHFFSKQHQNEAAVGFIQSSDALWIGAALSLGFLSLLSIERYFFQIHHHASCASHGDHHHHDTTFDHKHEQGAVWSLTLALCLHSLFDGVVLRSAGDITRIGIPLVFGLMLHKIPETASLVAVLRKGEMKPRSQALILGLFIISTPLGLFAAHRLQQVFSERGAGLLMAFAAGSLLHLVTGHLLPETTEPNSRTSKGSVFGIMLGGFLVMMCARMLGSE